MAHRLWRVLSPRNPVSPAAPQPLQEKMRPTTPFEDHMWPADRKQDKGSRPRDAELGVSRELPAAHRGTRTYLVFAVLSALGLSLYYLFAQSPHVGPCGSSIKLARADDIAADLCPQTGVIAPIRNAAFLNALEAEFRTDAFKLKAYESLGGAVRVP